MRDYIKEFIDLENQLIKDEGFIDNIIWNDMVVISINKLFKDVVIDLEITINDINKLLQKND